ncbi:hypothetical protein HRbin08_01450 [bacterium HR08]|nr:hypothetical protein HRbin08_01450 [bacterium HR08]
MALSGFTLARRRPISPHTFSPSGSSTVPTSEATRTNSAAARTLVAANPNPASSRRKARSAGSFSIRPTKCSAFSGVTPLNCFSKALRIESSITPATPLQMIVVTISRRLR